MDRRDPDGDAADAFAQTVSPPSSQAGAAADPLAPVAPTSEARTGVREPLPSMSGSIKAKDATDAAEVEPLPEVDLGLYTAEAEVARGGMGRIIAARDRRLGRQVAIKELIQGGPEAELRFRREALITARLQHPGIVPVYEAGRWPTGEPFYAMKLVGGRPLDKVIADARTLPDRLALLPRILAATEAIAYAHSHRVIHRDLKPGNILIGEFGETVVIDWGLAKDLDAVEPEAGAPIATGSAVRPAVSNAPITPQIRNRRPTGDSRGTGSASPRPGGEVTSAQRGDSSTLTVAGAVMGTPAYMAPEQARGESVDERADVFALGAMLYHVLAGTPPYAARTATDVIAAAVLGKVVPLADRAPSAPPDLLAIVAHAMAPEPAARYPTAGALAEELHRFLTGQLVGAHRYTAWQRVRRFVRRHRAAVSIAAVALVGFAVGGTLAIRNIVEARDRAEQQRQLAIRNRVAAERLVDFMQTDMTKRLEPIGRLDLLVPIGTEVRRYFEDLADAPGGMRPEDVDRMARALRSIATTDEKSGNTDAAIASWNEVKTRLSGLLAIDPGAAGAFERRLLLARTEVDLGRAVQVRGNVEDATALFAGAARTFGELLRQSPGHRETLLAAAEARDLLGDLLRNHGRLDESVAEYTTARELRDQLRAIAPPGDKEAVAALSTSHFKLGAVHYSRGESAEALREYRAAAQLRDTLVEAEPDNPNFQMDQVQVNTQIADLQRELGELAAAVATYETTVPIADGLVHRDPTNTEWRRFRGNLLSDYGFTLIDKADYAGALDRFRQARANHEELIARDPENTRWQVDMSRILTRSGDAYLALGDYAAAEEVLRQARTIRKALVDKNPKNEVWKRLLAWSTVKLAQLYGQRRAKGDHELALAAQEEALALRIELAAAAPDNALLRNELASSHINLARALTRGSAAPTPRAVELLDKGIALADALVAGDPVNVEWKETLVQGLYGRGLGANNAADAVTARAMLTRAATIGEEVLARSPDSAAWQANLAEVYEGLADTATLEGKPDEAAARLRQAFANVDEIAKAGRLPAWRKPFHKRLAAKVAALGGGGAPVPAPAPVAPP